MKVYVKARDVGYNKFSMKLEPAESVSGSIDLPGDKSISHRAAIFSAMAEGESRIENFSTAADCLSTLECLRGLGVEIRRENSTVFVKGVGKTGFRKPSNALDCGNSGTTVRLLAGVLAGQNFETVLTGDESLSTRPMKRVIVPMEKMGAQIEARKQLSAAENSRKKSAFFNRISDAGRQRTGQIVRPACRFERRRNYNRAKPENRKPKTVFEKSHGNYAEKSRRTDRRRFFDF